MFRTCGYALSAGFAGFFVHLCNSVHNMDCVKRTCLYTATKAKTAIITGFCPAAGHKGHSAAVFHTCVIVVLFCLFTGSGTFYKRHLPYAVPCRNPHNLTNLVSHRSTAHGTLIHRSLSFYNSGSQTGTSGIAAATTIITWKDTHNSLFPGVNFHFEFFSGNTKEKSNKKPYTAYNNGRN